MAVGAGDWPGDAGWGGLRCWGQEEGLAFVHKFSQNHGDEGSAITQAVGAYPLCHKGLLEEAAVPFFDLLGS